MTLQQQFIGARVLTKLGKYEIRRELGRGAMGIVYEGFDPFIERPVAIKTIQKSLIDQSEAREIFSRFRREAQAAGRLAHPNIIAVYEYGEEGDVAFIAMELLDGIELKEYFDKAKRFQLNESVNIMFQLLEALEYSHGRGVVHRDIKPSNILIGKDGKQKQEWLQARLEPAFPVQITFQGNYENGKIDVTTRNIEDFGTATFKLEPGDVTTGLLDDLGLFLIGGTNKPPGLLR